MSPMPVSELYQRYKIGTKKIVQWLANTAQHLNCLDSVITDQQRATLDMQRSEAGTTAVTLSTRQLVDLSNTIAETASVRKKSLHDCRDIAVIIKDVIAGRKEYSMWLNEHGQERDYRASGQHEHFVQVLHQILTAMGQINGTQQAKLNAGGKRPKRQGIGQSEQSALRNIFGALEVEEIDMEAVTDGLTSLQVSQPQQTAPAHEQSEAQFELEKTEGDLEFALWCFLSDCHKIKTCLVPIWADYYAGKASAPTVSHVAEVAFTLIGHATDELVKDFPDLTYYGKVAEHLKIGLETVGDRLEHLSHKTVCGLEGTATNEAEDFLCTKAYALLSVFKDARDKVAHKGDAAQSGLDNLVTLAKMSPFGHRLFEVFAPTVAPDDDWQGLVETEGFDQFTHNFFAQLSSTKPIRTFLVVQCQIYMDILEGYNSPTGQELNALRCVAQSMDEGFESFEQHVSALISEGRRERYLASKILKMVKEQIETFVMRKSSTPGKYEPSIMNTVHRWLPASAGALSTRLLQARYFDGMLACAKNRSIMALAHLYRACLASGLLKHAWEDLEFVIDQLGPDSLGLLGTAKSSSTAMLSARRFGMALGVKAAEYSKERQRSRGATTRVPLPEHKNFRRGDSEIDKLFPRAKYISALYPNKIEQSLDLSYRQHISRALQKMAHGIVKDHPKDVDENVRKEWLDCGKLEPDKLLCLLKQELDNEELQMYFDLHCFLMQALGFLRTIRLGLDADILQLRAESGREDKYTDIEMIDEILWVSAAREATSMGLKNSPLRSVASVLEQIIKQCGSQGLGHAKEVMGMQRFEMKRGTEVDWMKNMKDVEGEMKVMLRVGSCALMIVLCTELMERVRDT